MTGYDRHDGKNRWVGLNPHVNGFLGRTLFYESKRHAKACYGQL
ncbi:MAG: hypothetical protein ACXQS8_02785 [Candidatus Helarchaeales archaeon]